LNQSEIETMARQLLANGHEIVNDPAYADKVIINTCAVTREAAKDARKMTRHIRRENSSAGIILTGGYATVAPADLAILDGVEEIVPNRDKDSLVHLLDHRAQLALPVFDREPTLRQFLHGQTGNTRAFVKVQDGCDNRCTFCITTIARGEGLSRRLGDVVNEVQKLASAGYKEVVLTGVHLGSYGRDIDNKTRLSDLLQAILRHTDIPRLRISSLEPWDIPAGFFDLWHDRRLLPHLHVPLQSGSDKILRRMARKTSRESFAKLAQSARDSIPDLNLSTDLIAGFPGETEHDFIDCLDYVTEIDFSRLHVFTYSRRPGTAAAEMEDHLPKAERKERARRLIDLGRVLSQAFHKRYEGRTANVLWEKATGADENGMHWIGYTGNYIRVTAQGGSDLFNKITLARLSNAQPEGMVGALIMDDEASEG
jgi:threonylcarbamoyladenosine tRNA methylthiotransferase MtaB